MNNYLLKEGSPACRAACLFTVVFSGFFAHAFTLAERGGMPPCVIVLPEKATETQQYAAEELRNFTKRMTGVSLPVTNAVVAQGRSVVLSLATGKDLVHDAFRLRVEKDRLTVEGGSDSGILYGVYELLEKYGGCRWYSSWCEKIPVRDRFEVPDALDDTQKPAFSMREPFWFDMMKHPDFACRNRANGPSMGLHAKHGGTPFRFGGGLGSCHTFNMLCPPEKYFADHPEYFSEIKGKRVGAKNEQTQLCLTNPDVLRIVTSNVLDRIRKDPNATFYGVSQNDWYEFCTCPKCKAIDDAEESHAGTMIAFVNQIAEAVEKEFPNAVIETLAYQYTRKPPRNIKPRANVMPCLCTIECDYAFPIPVSTYAQNVKFMDDIKGWGKICRQIYIWDYTTDFGHYPMPFPNVLSLQGNVRFFRDNRVNYLFEQGAYQGSHGDFAELKAWLLARWMWNPDLPQEELLEDFFSGYYGAAAPYVRLYFDALHSFTRDSAKNPLGCFVNVHTSIFPDSFFDRATLLWDLAEKAVKDGPEVYRHNVRRGQFSVIYAQLMRKTKGEEIVAWIARNREPHLSRIKVLRSLARELLSRMKEAGDIRLCEGYETQQNRVEAWKRILRKQLSDAPQKRPSAVVEDSLLQLGRPGIFGERVKDPLAEDGSAIKLFNTHYEWSVTLPMTRIAYDAGAKYRLSVRIRVEKKPGVKTGMAFWTGVYDSGTKQDSGSINRKIDEVKDGYAWYEVLTWTPGDTQRFWAGPGVFDKQKGASAAHNGVYLDAIRIEQVESPSGSK